MNRKFYLPMSGTISRTLRLVYLLPALPTCGLHNSPPQAGAAAGKDIDWGYWGAGAPNNWGSLAPEFALCAVGIRQSPIDLTGYETDPTVPGLIFRYEGNAREIAHNGKIAHVEYEVGNTLTVGGQTCQLTSVHIHVHAEHQIDGQLFPAEMHLVHRRPDGGLAVVGQVFSLGNPDPVVQALIDAYPEAGQTGHSGFSLNAAGFVPADLGYYHYEGSLTTPPCSEDVKWYVFREIRTVSQEQVNRIAELHNGFNHRPIQAGNGRAIVYTGPRPVGQGR